MFKIKELDTETHHLLHKVHKGFTWWKSPLNYLKITDYTLHSHN